MLGRSVRRALSALLEDHDVATRWISGEDISEREQARTALTGSIADDRIASSVIVAIAALYRFLGRPFAVLLDELEQFTRYDTAQRTRRNITWLKRLLEQLASAGALTVVAGHWSAWEVERDYLDRFSQELVIDLPVMSSAEVLQLAQTFTGHAGEFSPEDAIEVARWSGGNMRRALALLHQLYAASDGFNKRLPAGIVATTAQSLMRE